MRKVSLLVALLMVATVAFGALGDIVASYPSPVGYPIALATAPNIAYTWAYCNASPYMVWRFHGTTGSIYGSYNFFGSSTRGLSYMNTTYLYVGNYSTDYIYNTNANNLGSLYSSYPANHDMYCGLAVKGTLDGSAGATEIYSSDNSPACIYLNNISTGSIISSFVPSAAIYDIAWDWRNGLVWGGVSGVMYGYNTAGSLVATFAAPAANPLSATYYGSYLWIGTTVSPNYIYRVHCPSGISGIAPSSLGRVKAIYK